MPVDRDKLIEQLRLITTDARTTLQLQEAITAAPDLTLGIDGAATLTIQLADHRRRLASSDAFTTRSYAQAFGYNFELVKAAKSGDQVTLTFEDAIAAALRREKGKRRWAANSSTRRDILIQLARKPGVKYLIDPKLARKVRNVVERGKDDNSWDLTGSLAADVGARRFSNGKRLIVGSDDWLLAQADKPIRIQENTGPWGSVDFDLDTGKRTSTASVTVDVEQGVLKPGTLMLIADDYPATDGKWIVSEYRHRLTTTHADLSLVRKQHLLKEPKGTGGAGEKGEDTFIPDREGEAGATEAGTSTAANPGRERMVAFALAQAGDAYVWGGNGPSAWDCSGLLQAATAAGGRQLTKPAQSQWGACVAAGVTIPVSEAVGIRGALLFRITSGGDHAAISLGNGSTIEAMGSAYGTLVAGNAATRGFTGGALWI